MDLETNLNALEAMLFAGGDPIPKKRLAVILNVSRGVIEDYAEIINSRYEKSALQIMDLGESFQLATKTGFGLYVKQILDTRNAPKLSEAQLEVLAIAAYNGKVTRTYVENVRGTDSSSIVATLVEKNLLEEAGRLDVPGKPVAFKVTDHFKRCFPDFGIRQMEFDDVEDSTQLIINN